jgi:hypothetical protein
MKSWVEQTSTSAMNGCELRIDCCCLMICCSFCILNASCRCALIYNRKRKVKHQQNDCKFKMLCNFLLRAKKRVLFWLWQTTRWWRENIMFAKILLRQVGWKFSRLVLVVILLAYFFVATCFWILRK